MLLSIIVQHTYLSSKIITCSGRTSELYTEGLRTSFMNELFTRNSNGRRQNEIKGINPDNIRK